MNAESHFIVGTSAVKTIIAAETVDFETVKRARGLFEEYKSYGVIYDCIFDDTKWNTTDEYSHITLNFNFNKVSYKRWYQEYFNLTFDEFQSFIKAFYILSFGQNVLHTFQTSLNDLKRLFRTDPEEIYGANIDLKIAVPSICIDFFSSFSDHNEKLDQLAEAIEQYFYICQNRYSGQRLLAEFDSYLLFDDVIKRFWKECTNEEMRLFYFPLYLWWQITGIVPMRPREFILTERNCLSKDDSGWYLRLRKNHLKGSKHDVHYSIAEDYFTVTYQIPDGLANEITWYIKATEEYERNDLNTLFVTDPHYHKWEQKKHKNSRFLTYINLNTILRYFYAEVIAGLYGIKVVDKGSHISINNGSELEYIHLGDTRHLSMINLMSQGGTPQLAMFLAGHDNEEMSMHYASNISKMIECRTYKQYREMTKGTALYSYSKNPILPMPKSDGIQLHDGGYCYSFQYADGSVEDCLKATGPDGEIGYCPVCVHYRAKGVSRFGVDSIYARAVTERCRELITAVNNLRKEKGNPETIGEMMLKLKDASLSYQQYLFKKKRMEELNGAK